MASERITRAKLSDAGRELVRLAKQYKGEPHREMRLDGLVFGFLEARFGRMERQHRIRMKNGGKPKRIDFRQRGLNSVVIEFAARTPERNGHYGSQNRDELRKLTRQVRASARYLLLLDVSGHEPTPFKRLRATYDEINAGGGRFGRKAVRIVYIHPEDDYPFIWKPFRAR